MLLPNTGHNLKDNIFVKDEILSFLKLFKDYRIKLEKKEKEKKKIEDEKK